MIKTKVTYLNKEIIVEEDEPSTIPELIGLIGEDAVVTNTNANLRYRNKYPRVYKHVSLELERMGFPRPPDQDEMVHIRSVWTQDSGKNQGEIRALFTSIAPEEPLYVKGERIGGGRIAQGALDAAHRYFAEGVEVVTEKVTVIEQMLPNYRVGRDVENKVTPETLARGIQTLQRHLMSQAKQTVESL